MTKEHSEKVKSSEEHMLMSTVCVEKMLIQS